MARVIKIGDVFEIPTKKGLAYGQVTHRHKEHGELVRILPGFFKDPPESFKCLVQEVELFKTFTPLGAAVHRKIFRVVANETVPEFAEKFPTFRAGNSISKKVATWWLWDGEKEWRVGTITEEQRKLPIRQICNAAALTERIENGYNYVDSDF